MSIRTMDMKTVKDIFEILYENNLEKNKEEKYLYKLNKVYTLYDRESGLRYSNNKYLDRQILNFKDIGITDEKREKEVIVSLTSFPQRMKDIKYTLYSLLIQSLKPNKIILWLAEDEFPNKEKDIPKEVLNFKNNGLTIDWCENLRAHKKLIPTLEKYPNAIIVTADDDVYYQKNWLEKLYNNYLSDKTSIHAYRGYIPNFDLKNYTIDYNYFNMKRNNISKLLGGYVQGCGGALYPPNSLYKDVCNKKLFSELTFYADDTWFWIMAFLNSTYINFIDNFKQNISTNLNRDLNRTDDFRLCKINSFYGKKNIDQMKNVINYYNKQIKEIIITKMVK